MVFGVLSLGAAFAALSVQAVLAEPLNFDSNTYRLTRIGYWLQEQRLTTFPDNDVRHNYIPCYPDLLMLWVTSFFANGYPAVNLVQTLSGAVLCLATWELGSAFQFRAHAKLAIVAALLSFPNVALQLVTSQSDLIATALSFSGIALLWHALHKRDNHYWVWCGLAFGTAIGAKPTVLFWGPGCLALLVYWGRNLHPFNLRDLRGLAGCAAIALMIAAPPYLNNIRLYENPFTPPKHSALLFPTPESGRMQYMAKNLTAYAWQLFEPNSNPLLPRALTEPPFSLLSRFIDSWDAPPSPRFRSSFDLGRQEYSNDMPNEDIASSGILSALAPTLALVLLILKLKRFPSIDRPGIQILIAGAALFLVVFAVTEAWTPSKYRYFILLSPVAAISVGVIVEALGPRWSAWGTTFIVSVSLLSLGLVSMNSYHHGWLTILDPERSPHSQITASMRALIAELPDRPMQIGIALRQNSWIAPFLRAGSPARFRFIPFEQTEETGTAECLQREKLDMLILNDGPDVDLALPQIRIPGYVIVGAPERVAFSSGLRRTSGFLPDGWTATDFAVTVQNVASPTPLRFSALNACTFEREIEISINGKIHSLSLAKANSVVDITLTLPAGSSSINWKITPSFNPSRDIIGSGDTRNLGLLRPRFSGITSLQ
jgi:uncharacterized membrane protein HdeD (DUF308 family)